MISNTYRRFSIEEIEFLKINYSILGAKECSKVLNRAVESVQEKACRLKLNCVKKPKFLTKEQEKEVCILYTKGLSSIQIAKIFECSKPTILKIIKDLPKRKTSEYSNARCHNQFGEKNSSWKGGIKSIYERIRDLNSYWTWRYSVLSRDNNQCTDCSSKDNLHAHHIITLKSLINNYCSINNKLIKELTEDDLNNSYFYDISNGLTLCEDCHKEYHRLNGR